LRNVEKFVISRERYESFHSRSTMKLNAK